MKKINKVGDMYTDSILFSVFPGLNVDTLIKVLEQLTSLAIITVLLKSEVSKELYVPSDDERERILAEIADIFGSKKYHTIVTNIITREFEPWYILPDSIQVLIDAKPELSTISDILTQSLEAFKKAAGSHTITVRHATDSFGTDQFKTIIGRLVQKEKVLSVRKNKVSTLKKSRNDKDEEEKEGDDLLETGDI